MTSDAARLAAVTAALELVPEQGVIGLGSGRAVFALTAAIGARPGGAAGLRAIVASSFTAARAADAGITVIDLDDHPVIDVAFDGADEIDPNGAMIKGGGAALLREKIVIAAAERVVILAEHTKQVDRLGQTRLLPVEVVQFGWRTTMARIQAITGDATLRTEDDGSPVVTDEGHFLIDVPVPPGDLDLLDRRLKGILGAVDHGLFLDVITDMVLGWEDGTATTTQRVG